MRTFGKLERIILGNFKTAMQKIMKKMKQFCHAIKTCHSLKACYPNIT